MRKKFNLVFNNSLKKNNLGVNSNFHSLDKITNLHGFCRTTSHLHSLWQQTGHTDGENSWQMAQTQLLIQSEIKVKVQCNMYSFTLYYQYVRSRDQSTQYLHMNCLNYSEKLYIGFMYHLNMAYCFF